MGEKCYGEKKTMMNSQKYGQNKHKRIECKQNIFCGYRKNIFMRKEFVVVRGVYSPFSVFFFLLNTSSILTAPPKETKSGKMILSWDQLI